MSMNCLKEALGYNLRYLLLDFISCPGLPNGANLDPPDLQILGAKKVTMQKNNAILLKPKESELYLEETRVRFADSAPLCSTC